MVRKPYWVTRQWACSLSAIPHGALNGLLTPRKRRARLRRKLMEQVDGIVLQNVENLRWAIFQSIDQTFARFGATLDRRLAETTQATHGAIRAALERREQHARSAAGETARKRRAEQELSTFKAALESHHS